MKVAASVTMDGGVLDEVLMASPPYQTHFSPGGDAGTLDFPCFMSPDPVSSCVYLGAMTPFTRSPGGGASKGEGRDVLHYSTSAEVEKVTWPNRTAHLITS